MASPPPTDYEIYLRVPELLSLQKPVPELSCHDELQFQIVHQAAELWMKLVEHEMLHLGRILDDGMLDGPALGQALTTLKRVHLVQGLLMGGVEVLYTMHPRDYMRIRAVLGRGSGQESPGFRRLLSLSGDVWPSFERLLDRRGVPLRQLYEEPERMADLLAVAEGLIEFDLRLQEWRNRHLLLVYRTIGIGTPSLKGKHSELLEKGLRTQFFPKLWEVRDELYEGWAKAHPTGATVTLSLSGGGPDKGAR
jgi:tryptophan 2,3-dioxygenase